MARDKKITNTTNYYAGENSRIEIIRKEEIQSWRTLKCDLDVVIAFYCTWRRYVVDICVANVFL